MDILSMVDLTSISAMLAAIGVMVGVVFAVLELRSLVRTRQTDLTMRLYQHFGTKEFINSWWQVESREEKDYDEYLKKYGGIDFLYVSVFLEGIGILLHRNLIDIDMVRDLFGPSTKSLWEKYESILKRMHTDECVWVEFLYNKLQKREHTLQQIPQ